MTKFPVKATKRWEAVHATADCPHCHGAGRGSNGRTSCVFCHPNLDEQVLLELTQDCVIPSSRRTDWFWLRRNFMINNGDHPQAARIMTLINNHIRR